MRLHLLGICGTFMAGLAQIACEAGHEVSGCDEQVYPPMSTQLAEAGIEVMTGYKPEHLTPAPDLVIIGNAMSRGNPAVEYVLANNLPYMSGPQWLYEHVLRERWVLAVAGTHGKTTTSSLLAWILEYAGLNPGFLIGGRCHNFPRSARLGAEPFFVIEADEYDTAFFDKRSKFIHYHPRTLILNNLEYDHADIFPDFAALQRQFQHLVRTVPSNGLIIAGDDDNITQLLAQECWSEVQSLRQHWQVEGAAADGHCFTVCDQGKAQGRVDWSLLGQHNIANALAAIAAAKHVGVTPAISVEALKQFKGIKRRLEVLGEVAGITVYDDFAHHPTAIATTLQGLRQRVGQQRIIAVVDFASYTMRVGEHQHRIVPALQQADRVYLAKPQGCTWSMDNLANDRIAIGESTDAIVATVLQQAEPGDHILVMSNRGFDGIHQRLLDGLQSERINKAI